MREKRVDRRRIYLVAILIVTSAGLFVWPHLESRTVAKSTSAEASRVDPQQVNRGRYLVKIAGCNDCHTPGYVQRAGDVSESQWLIGDHLGWQGPWGTTYPANLRSLVAGIPAEQWFQIARRQMRPPMPWFALRDMSDDDLLAIYHYIRSLGPSEKRVPAFVPPGQPVHTPVVKMPS